MIPNPCLEDECYSHLEKVRSVRRYIFSNRITKISVTITKISVTIISKTH